MVTGHSPPIFLAWSRPSLRVITLRREEITSVVYSPRGAKGGEFSRRKDPRAPPPISHTSFPS